MLSTKKLWILFGLLCLGGLIGIISSYLAPRYDDIKLIEFEYYGKMVWYRGSQRVELVGQNLNSFLWLMMVWLMFYWNKFLPAFLLTEYWSDWVVIDTIVVIFMNPNVDRDNYKIEMQVASAVIFLIRCWYIIFLKKRFKTEE